MRIVRVHITNGQICTAIILYQYTIYYRRGIVYIAIIDSIRTQYHIRLAHHMNGHRNLVNRILRIVRFKNHRGIIGAKCKVRNCDEDAFRYWVTCGECTSGCTHRASPGYIIALPHMDLTRLPWDRIVIVRIQLDGQISCIHNIG